jgi:hypothetical protein
MSEMSDSEYRQKMKEHLASFGITDAMGTDFKPIDESKLCFKNYDGWRGMKTSVETDKQALKFINAEVS